MIARLNGRNSVLDGHMSNNVLVLRSQGVKIECGPTDVPIYILDRNEEGVGSGVQKGSSM